MADEAHALVETPRFSPSTVLEDSFETLRRSAPTLLGITLIVAVPLFVWLLLGGEKLLVQFAAPTRLETAGGQFDFGAAMLLAMLGLIGLAIQGAVSDAAFHDLIGDADDLLQSLARALVVAPKLIAAGAVVALMFGFAAVTALAAGLVAGLVHWALGLLVALGGFAGLAMLMVQLWVQLPAIVVEGSGPVDSFRRSSELTQGNRWRILGLLLIVYVPEVAAKLLLLAAVPALGAIAVAVLNIIVTGVFVVFNAVLTVMIYGHLRAIKEGSSTAGLAEVFE